MTAAFSPRCLLDLFPCPWPGVVFDDKHPRALPLLQNSQPPLSYG